MVIILYVNLIDNLKREFMESLLVISSKLPFLKIINKSFIEKAFDQIENDPILNEALN